MSRIKISRFEQSIRWHVIFGGNGGAPILTNNHHRSVLLAHFERASANSAFEVNAHAAMGNHCHLLGKGTGPQVSAFAHDAKTMFARFLNTERGSSGHVFHPRNWVRPIHTERGALQLSAYIHLNPNPDGSRSWNGAERWTSLRYYRAPDSAPGWLHPAPILQILKEALPECRSYDEFLRAYLHRRLRPEGDDSRRISIPPELQDRIDRTIVRVEFVLLKHLPYCQDRDRVAQRMAFYALTDRQRWPAQLVASAMGWKNKDILYRARKQNQRIEKLLERYPQILKEILA